MLRRIKKISAMTDALGKVRAQIHSPVATSSARTNSKRTGALDVEARPPARDAVVVDVLPHLASGNLVAAASRVAGSICRV